MKKVFLLLLAVLSAAVAADDSPAPEKKVAFPPGLAAELVPGDTAVFLEIPDLARSAERWKKNGLYLLTQEPEWKDFTAKFAEFAAANQIPKAILGELEELRKVDIAGLFIAVGKDFQPFPNVVGGLAYRGQKSDAEKIVGKLKGLLLKAVPNAKSEMSKHGEIEIESIPLGASENPDALALPVLRLAYHDHWVFFAVDQPTPKGEGKAPTMFAAMLDRYLHKPDAAAGLAKDALFQETLKQNNPDPDLTLWVRGTVFEPLTNEFFSMILPGQKLAEAPKDPNPLQAVLYSWKLDGAVMRDRLYFHFAEPPKLGAVEHRSVALTNPNTYFYLGLNYDNLIQRTKWLSDPADGQKADEKNPNREPLSLFGFMNPVALLRQLGLEFKDLITAFGPEMALSSSWPGGVFSRLTTDFFAAIEVRDVAKARTVAEAMVKAIESTSDKPAIVKTAGEVTRWTASTPLAEVGPFKPYKLALGLTGSHLILGITPDAVDTAIKQFANKGANMASKPGSAFGQAVQAVNPPNGAVFFVDTKIVFERLYSILKPTLAFQIVGNPELSEYFDSGKLPADTTISKHLAPFVISYGAVGQGWVVESTGPFSFLGVGAVAVPGLLAVRSAPVEIRKDEAEARAFGVDSRIEKAQDIRVVADLQAIETMLLTYQVLTGTFPSTQQGVKALVAKPEGEPVPKKWKQLMSGVPRDPWGAEYQYRQPGKRNQETYDLFSNGPDKLPDTADDIGNWRE